MIAYASLFQLSLWYASSCVNYAFCHEGKSVPIAITGVAAFGEAFYEK